MKKILLATTMLVGTAGFAAAEVSLSGDGRMGIIQNFGDGDVGFTSRARVTFTLSGESDSGLSFGGSFRADNASGAAGGTAGSVFISGAFGKLSMGDVDGAALSAVGHIDGVGLTGLGDTNESIFIANGGLDTDDLLGTDIGGVTADPTALYEYSAGAFTVYLSATQPSYAVSIPTNTTTTSPSTTTYEGEAYAIGAKYSVDAYTFGIGYESLMVDDVTNDDEVVDLDHVIASVAATFSGVTVKATYGEADGTVLGDDVELTQYGVSATYSMDALSLTAFANNKEATIDGSEELDTNAYGLGASYDLGGGASVVGGVVRTKDIDGESDTAYDLGVKFSF